MNIGLQEAYLEALQGGGTTGGLVGKHTTDRAPEHTRRSTVVHGALLGVGGRALVQELQELDFVAHVYRAERGNGRACQHWCWSTGFQFAPHRSFRRHDTPPRLPQKEPTRGVCTQRLLHVSRERIGRPTPFFVVQYVGRTGGLLQPTLDHSSAAWPNQNAAIPTCIHADMQANTQPLTHTHPKPSARAYKRREEPNRVRLLPRAKADRYAQHTH